MIPEAYLYRHYDTFFYHIVLPDFNKSSEAVVNFVEEGTKKDKFKVISGKVHLVLRRGGVDGWQFFFENNRNPHQEDKVIIKESNGKSKNKVFLEQYFPVPESFRFINKCLKVFERVYYKTTINNMTINDTEFKQMVYSEFLKEEKEDDGQTTLI